MKTEQLKFTCNLCNVSVSTPTGYDRPSTDWALLTISEKNTGEDKDCHICPECLQKLKKLNQFTNKVP